MADAPRPRKKKPAPGTADVVSQQADVVRRQADELRRQADELRLRAEERLYRLSAAAAAAAASSSADDLAAAVHELRVHQIELEMQNEELRRSHLELDEQREKYFELFDLAPVGYLTVGERGLVGDANLTAAHLLGVERQLLVGQPLSAFVLAPDRDAYYLHRRLLEKTGEPQSCEVRLRRVGDETGGDETGGGETCAGASPGYFWARLEERPRRSAEGEPPVWWVTFADITGRKQAETNVQRLNDELEDRVLARTAELGAANRELEAFVYSASHDLRAPLRAIDGFSQMVIEDAAERLDATDVAHLQRVRAAAERMALLIDGLLVLSRVARKELVRERVDLSALATSVIADLRIAEPERHVEAVVQPDLVVAADPTLLNMILTNLLGNAWKFTAKHETARIEVGVVDADGKRAFFVRDDGAGFDIAAAEHLFGAFQRFHVAADFAGDGIGLATVQRLVTRHGGWVWAEAEVEKGATFFFTLPAEAGEG